MTGATREENIFAMVDDVIERRYPRARERIERLRSDTGAAVPQIMAMPRHAGAEASCGQGRDGSPRVTI